LTLSADEAKRIDRVTKKTVDMHEYLGVDKPEPKREKASSVKLAAAKAALQNMPKEAASSCSPTPRKGDGKYLKKSPNKSKKVNVLAKDKEDK